MLPLCSCSISPKVFVHPSCDDRVDTEVTSALRPLTRGVLKAKASLVTLGVGGHSRVKHRPDDQHSEGVRPGKCHFVATRGI
ncbi:Hypothetical predicted protein [Xyrichtys novacula]|uniref:Uncharacterized protein n=1 Tax=Xyrichtys novacula TaxID=13765 RepID=A0AAV1G9H2_XYRNO|nr:Hypothetical predicted protein [Xyrichtys novacula]